MTDSSAFQGHNQAVLLAKAGREAEACELLSHILAQSDPDAIDVRTLKAAWQIGAGAGQWALALAAGFRAAVRDPLDFRFCDRLLKSLGDCPATALPATLAMLPAALPSLSIVIVSRDDARFAGAHAAFGEAFARWPHDIHRVHDAASMYDGYARGLAATRGEIVIFAHDDIRFAIPDFAARLCDAMATADMVGVAGAAKVSGPAVLWAGHPWLRGAITHHAPAEASYELALLSFEGPRMVHAQAVDGVFVAVRRTLAERVGFDQVTFDGFHLYDLDFSYRAHLAGARVTIAADLALVHASRGSFDERFSAASKAFEAKFPALCGPPGEHRHWYALAVPDEQAVTASWRKLIAAWSLRFPVATY